MELILQKSGVDSFVTTQLMSLNTPVLIRVPPTSLSLFTVTAFALGTPDQDNATDYARGPTQADFDFGRELWDMDAAAFTAKRESLLETFPFGLNALVLGNVRTVGIPHVGNPRTLIPEGLIINDGISWLTMVAELERLLGIDPQSNNPFSYDAIGTVRFILFERRGDNFYDPTGDLWDNFIARIMVQFQNFRMELLSHGVNVEAFNESAHIDRWFQRVVELSGFRS